MTDDVRARRKYARSLKYSDRVKYNAGDDVEEGSFICLTKDPVSVCVSTGTARKYVDLSRLVLPCIPPVPKNVSRSTKATPKKADVELPASLRRELGIGLPQ